MSLPSGNAGSIWAIALLREDQNPRYTQSIGREKLFEKKDPRSTPQSPTSTTSRTFRRREAQSLPPEAKSPPCQLGSLILWRFDGQPVARRRQKTNSREKAGRARDAAAAFLQLILHDAPAPV